ncbi:MAG: hypothetical protein EWV80_00125 [Microcystis aeruginosa Ma_QC_B_20070730_S2]|uniref:Uncharacterized protein n=1 Tax=Microcystis aeruginosa Ma_QC_B_20070730_S2 TaxID=2486256 RepID=A0A552EB91_MICAE|nr:MAG: hypothetical protein EWV80_00125 [Microcystis aeruginosa Ma_QC_B_20070730_S2]
MTNNKNDNYANLPDELLEDILEDAPKIAEKIKPLFNELQPTFRTLSCHREKLRREKIKVSIKINVNIQV